MRAPQYERQVRDQGAPNFRVSDKAPREAFGVVADTSHAAKAQEQGGRALQGIGNNLMALGAKMQKDVEDAEYMDAVNAGSTWLQSYKNDPETGIMLRQGRDAVGMSGEAQKAMQLKGEEIAKGLKHANSQKAFKEKWGSLTLNAHGSIMAREADQASAYRNATMKQNVAVSLGNIAADHNNDDTFNKNIDDIEAVNVQMYGHLGPEYVQQANAEALSQAHVSRITAWLGTGEFKQAAAYFKQNKSEIQGELRVKTESLIMEKGKSLWAQENADAIMGQFKNEYSAIQYIRKNFEGEKEEWLVTAIKTRFNERELQEQKAVSSKTKRKQEFARYVYDNFTSKGEPVPDAVIQQAYDEGIIEPNDVERFKAGNVEITTYGYHRKKVLQEPGSDKLTPDQVETQVQKRMGITQQEHAEAFTWALEAELEKGIPTEDWKMLEARGLVTPSDRKRIQSYAKGLSGWKKQVLSQAKQELKQIMQVFKNSMGVDIDGAIADFSRQVTDLDPADPHFEDQVQRIYKNIFTEAADRSGKSQTGWLGGLSDFGKDVQRVERQGADLPRRPQLRKPAGAATPEELAAQAAEDAKNKALNEVWGK